MDEVPGGSDGMAPFDELTARVAFESACSMVGLDPVEAELVRFGENATFRLRTRPVVVRVARTASRLLAARREIAVSRWLAEERVPAITALDVTQPVAVNGRVATFWESVTARPEYGTVAELAELLRDLHRLSPPAALDLPAVAPFDRARARIDAAVLPVHDRGFLLERCTQLASAFGALTFDLPPVALHGDASVGNVIRDDEGRAMLADLDGFAYGPREWDLVLTALYYERFGWHTAVEYQTFAEVYGYDVMTWPGYPVLRDVREFLMVAWLAQKASHDESVAVELERRVSDLRTGASRRGWKPF